MDFRGSVAKQRASRPATPPGQMSRPSIQDESQRQFSDATARGRASDLAPMQSRAQDQAKEKAAQKQDMSAPKRPMDATVPRAVAQTSVMAGPKPAMDPTSGYNAGNTNQTDTRTQSQKDTIAQRRQAAMQRQLAA